jgi:anti-sigma factor RsiW
MPPDPHPTLQELEAFALGILAEARSLAVEAHLAECPSCQHQVAGVPEDVFIGLLRTVREPAGRTDAGW